MAETNQNKRLEVILDEGGIDRSDLLGSLDLKSLLKLAEQWPVGFEVILNGVRVRVIENLKDTNDGKDDESGDGLVEAAEPALDEDKVEQQVRDKMAAIIAKYIDNPSARMHHSREGEPRADLKAVKRLDEALAAELIRKEIENAARSNHNLRRVFLLITHLTHSAFEVG